MFQRLEDRYHWSFIDLQCKCKVQNNIGKKKNQKRSARAERRHQLCIQYQMTAQRSMQTYDNNIASASPMRCCRIKHVTKLSAQPL